MEFWVYILQSEKNGRYYIGQSQHPEARILKHNAGKVTSTRHHAPWKIIYTESFDSRSEAMKRETEIKGFKSRKRIEELVAQLVPKNKNSPNS